MARTKQSARKKKAPRDKEGKVITKPYDRPADTVAFSENIGNDTQDNDTPTSCEQAPSPTNGEKSPTNGHATQKKNSHPRINFNLSRIINN